MNDLKVHVYVDRQQDVRATEIDKVDMHSSFRPGDTVRALVVSFSDSVLAIWELGWNSSEAFSKIIDSDLFLTPNSKEL